MSYVLHENRQHGRIVTQDEHRQMHRLRKSGFTYQQIGDLLKRDESTVRKHLNGGYITKVPVAPLREAFLASRFTPSDVARELGWHHNHGADSSRVKRTLGILPETSGRIGRRNGRSYRTMVDAETVERIAYAIGRMPWEFIPDNEGEVDG